MLCSIWQTLKISGLALLLAACSGSTSQGTPAPPQTNQAPPTTTESLAESLSRTLDDAVMDQRLPSVSLYYENGSTGEVLSLQAGHGSTQPQAAEITEASRYQIASNGKVFTAVAIQRLAEQGLLNLDDLVSEWLPQALQPGAASLDGVTVRMLLNHTSGLPDYLQELDYLDQFTQTPGLVWSLADTLAYVVDAPVTNAPGAAHNYSNTNYALLGAVIEQATEQSLAEAMRFWVLDPARLTNTYSSGEQRGQPPLIEGYHDQTGQVLFQGQGAIVSARPWSETHWFADAPVQATPRDMVRFMRALFVEEQLLSSDALDEMLDPALPGVSYGLGIIVGRTSSGAPVYMHGGSIWGYRSEMFHLPESNVTLALATSGEGGEYNVRFTDLLRDVLELLGHD